MRTLTHTSTIVESAARMIDRQEPVPARIAIPNCGFAGRTTLSHGMNNAAVARIDHCATCADDRNATDANIGRRCHESLVDPYASANVDSPTNRADAIASEKNANGIPSRYAVAG
jgi:hypothetical protein